MQNERVIPTLTARETDALIKSHVIKGGMIPKVRAALDALSGGAHMARITNLEGLSSGGGTRFSAE